jgi:hypothetical protein
LEFPQIRPWRRKSHLWRWFHRNSRERFQFDR